MANWDRIVKAHHKRGHSDDGYEFASNSGATDAELSSLEKRLGIALPADFRGLYTAFNGFGVKSPDDPDNVYWFAQPLENLIQFMETIRNWFRKTHADLSDRFFPFIDWANGDGLGYLVDENGRVMPGLYCFEHESYEGSADQDSDEFMRHAPVSLEKLLKSI